ncbi:circumsporozoite protein-like [Xenia sp. Carnegie-2017]|uniref:circumsporozoite protein-like n=1 Tax=Xenia sp. Carnegie-2017 TaxID=2897299 RepID=UPI001F039DF1|nr:circumsporozoite protein-like [Xenia sp. Carnegie-2017]
MEEMSHKSVGQTHANTLDEFSQSSSSTLADNNCEIPYNTNKNPNNPNENPHKANVHHNDNSQNSKNANKNPVYNGKENPNSVVKNACNINEKPNNVNEIFNQTKKNANDTNENTIITIGCTDVYDIAETIESNGNNTNEEQQYFQKFCSYDKPDEDEEPVSKSPKILTSTQSIYQKKVKTGEGSKLVVFNEDKIPQALCTLFSMKTLHNRPVPKSHVGIVIDYVMPNCKLKPVCPTELDGDFVEKGAFYIWPLELLALNNNFPK